MVITFKDSLRKPSRQRHLVKICKIPFLIKIGALCCCPVTGVQISFARVLLDFPTPKCRRSASTAQDWTASQLVALLENPGETRKARSLTHSFDLIWEICGTGEVIRSKFPFPRLVMDVTYLLQHWGKYLVDAIYRSRLLSSA